ncbi:TonB-dependent receptor [uncultured Polaribacter sp.]|uniref:TonB-dependent receptor n=1 Tax=uncultured Polaribacter sp. TaxID=174711 RepID=UPI00262C60CA|nr:TonB-dependent receptor [uncultured Polaribacter sp.]
MQKIVFLCIAILCNQFTIAAQDCNLTFKGKVSDFHDSSPIVGASVHILTSNKYTTSDLDGVFEFKNLCTGKIVIEIKHLACETKRISLNLQKNVTREFYLEHHLEELNEVVVTSNTKTAVTSIEQSIKQNTIDHFTDGSLGDALNTISGVSSLNTGNTIVKPMIHGLHSSRLLIINNNVRLYDQEWGDEHAPNVDLNASGKIDVIKGSNTLKYGSDAIGGLILIKPKKYAANDSIFGSTLISLNSNGLGRSLNSEIVKTYDAGYYAKLQINNRHSGDFKAPNYFLNNTGLESLNASFAFGKNGFEKGFNAYYSFVNNKLGILRASHIGNVGDLVNAIQSDEPLIQDDFSFNIIAPRQEITHHLAKVDFYKRFKDFGKLSLQYDFQSNRRKEFDLRRGNLRNTPVIDLSLLTTSIQSDLQVDSFDNLKLNTGILLRYQQNDAISTGVRPLIPDFEKYDAGFYTIGNYSLNENLELNAGVRYDFSYINAQKNYLKADWNTTFNYDELFPQFETGVSNATQIATNPEFTFHNVSASLGLAKQFKNDVALVFNYGLASRVPNPSELFSDGLHHSAARIEIGMLTIDKEVANKFILSLERNNTNFGFSINPFYKKIDNFIQLIPTGITTTIRGAFPVWEYNQVNAQIFGVDVDINKKIDTLWDYNGSLSLLQGDNLTENISLINIPAANFSNSISYTNKDLNELFIALKQTTHLRQNQFPDYNFSTFNPVTRQDVFVDISTPPNGFTLFGLQTSAVFSAFKKNDLKIEANVNNLFNVSYRNYLNRFRFFADELGRNVNIKIKLNY